MSQTGRYGRADRWVERGALVVGGLCILWLVLIASCNLARAEYQSPYDGALVPCTGAVVPVGYDYWSPTYGPVHSTPIPPGVVIENVVVAVESLSTGFMGHAWISNEPSYGALLPFEVYGESHGAGPAHQNTVSWAGRVRMDTGVFLFTQCDPRAGQMVVYVKVSFTR